MLLSISDFNRNKSYLSGTLLAIWLRFQKNQKRQPSTFLTVLASQTIKILLKRERNLFFIRQVSSYDSVSCEEAAVLSKEPIYIFTVITLIAL